MTWLLTVTGRKFNPADPQPDTIDLADIAHGLSLECRFAGQCSAFYSVAQHSVMASHIVPPEHALEALLHDATEAYLKDIPRPVKAILPDYRALEAKLDSVIRTRLGLPVQKSAEVAHADLVMLATERRDLMPDDDPWPILHGIEPLAERLYAWTPWQAEALFIQRAMEIMRWLPA